MWEFTLINKITGETKLVFGTTYSRAIEKAKLENPQDWECVSSDFVD